MYATYSNLVTPGNVVTQAEYKMRFAGNHHSSLFYGRTLNIDVYLKITSPYSKGILIYDAYKMELEQGRKLYTHLDRQVSWGDDLQRCEDISKQHIRQLLVLLNLSVNITDIELDMIQKFVSSKTSPYIR